MVGLSQSECVLHCYVTGKFQSHWRLCYQGARFGHRVWCCVVVDPKEVLEPAEKKDQPMGFCTLGSLQVISIYHYEVFIMKLIRNPCSPS